MKRLLLLSYHFAPLNSIATHRAVAFAEHLHAHGIHPIVVTHVWEQKGSGGEWQIGRGEEVEVEEHASHTVIRLPLPEDAQPYQASSLQTLYHLYKGRFDLGGMLPVSRKAYARFLAQNGSELGELHGVLAIFNPHHHLELGARFARQRGLPFFADLRDLWAADVGGEPLHHSPKDRLRNRFMRRHWKRWLKEAAVVSTVTQPWADFMTEFLGKPALCVRNGIERGAFENITPLTTSAFTVAYIGTLYPEQELEPLAEALRSLPPNTRWEFQWIGARSETALAELSQRLQALGVPARRIHGRTRVARAEALAWLRSAHLLVYPTWPNVPGIVGGKVYEYLASGTPVLVTARHRNLDVVHLTEASEMGRAFTPDQQPPLNAWVQSLYSAWESGQPVRGAVNEEGYLREVQVGVWVEGVKDYVLP